MNVREKRDIQKYSKNPSKISTTFINHQKKSYNLMSYLAEFVFDIYIQT